MSRHGRVNRNAWSWLVCLLLLAACSTDDNKTGPPSGNSQTRIEGTVIDARSGEAIRDAVIRTDPPSEEITSASDGSFALIDPVNGSGIAQVIVEHFAYDSAQTQVSVAEGNTTRVDFALQSNAIGLHASPSQLNFPADTNRQTIRLSSNIQNTGFSVLVSDPWFTVTPMRGVISNRESVLLQVLLDRSQLPARLPASSEIIINSDNGTRELVITAIVNAPADDALSTTDNASSTPLHSRQNDCRQLDVLRFGLDDPDGPLVQFLPSIVLPAQAGPRNLETNNPFLIDSVVVQELGEIVITHVAGGPDATSLEIFELNKSDEIVTVAVNRGSTADNRRATLRWALIPGVYCYYLGGTDANFDQTYQLQIVVDFLLPE